jgi:hypothetical protein
MPASFHECHIDALANAFACVVGLSGNILFGVPGFPRRVASGHAHAQIFEERCLLLSQ